MIKSKPKNPVFEFQREMINLFLKDPKKANWPREMKIAKTLLTEHADMDFWRYLELGFKLNSLAFFITQDGKDILVAAKKKKFIVLPEPKRYQVNDDNIKQFSSGGKSNNSLVDFLRK